MKPTHLIMRYGELFLKGRNRVLFENKLIENIKKEAPLPIQRLPGRLIGEYFPDHASLRRVFGLISYSPAWYSGRDLFQIQELALKLLEDKKGTFKVETQRSDKAFPFTSTELNRLIGQYVEEKTALLFKMEKPTIILSIEINQQGVYFFMETISCCGGMPVGSGGKLLLLLENEASILAGILMMKRGAMIMPVSFLNKMIDLSLLQHYSPVPLSIKYCRSRDEMEEYALTVKATALVQGCLLDDLGDNHNDNNLQKIKTSLLVFKPLIGYTQKDIAVKLEFFREMV